MLHWGRTGTAAPEHEGTGSTAGPGHLLLPSSGLTIAGDVQLHQLHEVGHLGGQPLDLIVTQAQLAQVQEPEERL